MLHNLRDARTNISELVESFKKIAQIAVPLDGEQG